MNNIEQLVRYLGRKLTSRKFALALAALVAVLLEDMSDEHRAMAMSIITSIYVFSEAVIDAIRTRG